MPKLIVNPDTEVAWEIPLTAGVTVLGRGSGSLFPIDHPSISSRHCEIEINNGTVVLRDLGSTNGTRVEQQAVQEVQLRSGQRIRLGEVELRFEQEALETPRVAQAPAIGPTNCKFHPRSAARHYCRKCQRGYCELCVSARSGGHFCRTCGNACEGVRVELAARDTSPASFFALLPGIFKYPFTGSGAWMLLFGTVAYVVTDFLANFSFYIQILLGGYIAAYVQGIIQSSAQGEEQGPTWPDISGGLWSDIVVPYFKFLTVGIVSFAPAIGLTIWAASGEEKAALGLIPAYVWGCLYFPMALLAVAMFDTVAAVNPLVVIPAIVKLPLEYVVVCVFFGGALIMKWLCDTALPGVIGLPVVPAVIGALVGFYLLTMTMRMMGLLYFTKRDRLGWFN